MEAKRRALGRSDPGPLDRGRGRSLPRATGAAALLGLALAAGLAARPAPAHALGRPAPSARGEIAGRVIDRTAPAHALPGRVVRLEIVERGSSAERRAVTDARGRFAFTGLPVGGIRVFLLATEYRGVPYESGQIVLTTEAPARSVDLTVYEPAPDRSAARLALVFGVIDVARGGIRVSTIQRYENATDRAVPAGERDPLTVPLPRGAEAVSPLAGWRDPRVADGRITDVLPLLPGVTQVAYAYALEARAAARVPWRLPDGAGDVEVLVADAGVRVAGDGLRFVGTVTEAGHRYQRWSGGPVPRGGEVSLRLEGVPAGQDAWPAAVAGGLAIVLGGGLAHALRTRRARS